MYKAPALPNQEYFSVEDTTSKTRFVALKVTTPSMMEPPHDSKREAQILALAASHRVVPLLDTFREDGSRFVLVFPFLRYDFHDVLREGKISKVQVKSCLKDLFSALTFIHKQGVIHRDIKPSNILLRSLDGPAYLSDFGIAWASGVSSSETADAKITDVGTTCYRAPELLFGNKHYGCSLDLWAAGCTVAEALDPSHETLFDSGELGSDLALIQSIFKKLGTPNLNVWPVRRVHFRLLEAVLSKAGGRNPSGLGQGSVPPISCADLVCTAVRQLGRGARSCRQPSQIREQHANVCL